MPTLEEDGWELESAEERYAAAPASFDIPSREERECVPVGSMVKLLFLFANRHCCEAIVQCERMWVTVMSTDGKLYRGRLESLPGSSEALQPGAVVFFGPEHMASVLVPKTDPRHPDYRASSWWTRLLGRGRT